MNRDIKFRYWDKNENKMYKVGVIDFDDKKAYMTGYMNYTASSFLLKNVELMQYTGLKDKNGVEIYEGDILEVDDTGRVLFGTRENPSRKYELVGFHDGAFMTGRNNIGYEHMDTYLWILKNYITVVGNKFDNPELLEKG